MTSLRVTEEYRVGSIISFQAVIIYLKAPHVHCLGLDVIQTQGVSFQKFKKALEAWGAQYCPSPLMFLKSFLWLCVCERSTGRVCNVWVLLHCWGKQITAEFFQPGSGQKVPSVALQFLAATAPQSQMDGWTEITIWVLFSCPATDHLFPNKHKQIPQLVYHLHFMEFKYFKQSSCVYIWRTI